MDYDNRLQQELQLDKRLQQESDKYEVQATLRLLDERADKLTMDEEHAITKKIKCINDEIQEVGMLYDGRGEYHINVRFSQPKPDTFDCFQGKVLMIQSKEPNIPLFKIVKRNDAWKFDYQTFHESLKI